MTDEKQPTQPLSPGDLVEIIGMAGLMIDCWPYGMVFDRDTTDPNRVLVVCVGDHVRRNGNGAGCRVFLEDDLKVLHHEDRT